MALYEVEALPVNIAYGATGVVEIIQNVRMIITTRKRTQPLDRDFGLEYSFLDSPINTVQAKISQELFEAIRRYEPRAIVKEIKYNDYRQDPLVGKIVPAVVIEIQGV